MKAWLALGIVVLGISACSQQIEKKTVDLTKYKVKSTVALQQHINQLNEKLAIDFTVFKKKEINAFAHQFPLDVDDLKSLNQHLMASTALKPTKIAYCDLMNTYFAELYHWGHANLTLLDDVRLSKDANPSENLKLHFSSAENFYHFILDKHTSYRQVQQTMGYGCNLKAAL